MSLGFIFQVTSVFLNTHSYTLLIMAPQMYMDYFENLEKEVRMFTYFQ